MYFHAKKEDSHILKHWELEHEGKVDPQLRFDIVRTFKDELSRQIEEAVCVNLRGTVSNSKGVYKRCTLPRFVLEKPGNDLREVKYNKEGVQTTSVDELAIGLVYSKRRGVEGLDGVEGQKRKKTRYLADTDKDS